MRSHGVPNFPDPLRGGGFNLGQNSDINPKSPAYLSAEKACVKLQGAASGPAPVPERRRLAMVAFAQCIRAHGVPNFADPTFGNDDVAPGAPGASVPLPVDVRSPAFRKAAKACAGLQAAAHGR